MQCFYIIAEWLVFKQLYQAAMYSILTACIKY